MNISCNLLGRAFRWKQLGLTLILKTKFILMLTLRKFSSYCTLLYTSIQTLTANHSHWSVSYTQRSPGCATRGKCSAECTTMHRTDCGSTFCMEPSKSNNLNRSPFLSRWNNNPGLPMSSRILSQQSTVLCAEKNFSSVGKFCSPVSS